MSATLLAIVRCLCTTTTDEHSVWATDYRLAGERPLSRPSEVKAQRVLEALLAKQAAPYTAALSELSPLDELPLSLRAKAADARRVLASERACFLAAGRRCAEAALASA